MLINFESVRDTQNMSMNHDYETWVRFQIPSTKTSVEITMTSYPVGNITSLTRKPCILDKKVTMEHYQEVMVTLSENLS